MATYIPVTNIPEQFFDNSGDPLVSGTLEFYLSGTTTATDLFTSDGTSIGTSITLNSWGYPESGGALITLFRDQSKALKLVLKNSSGSTIWTADGIPATAAFDSTSAAKLDLITVTSAINLDTLAAGSYLPLAGGTLTDDLTMGPGAQLLKSVTAGITASTTQTQAGGTALISGINEVSTVANAGDAVTLPTAVAGLEIKVFNNGANAMSVFPAADDNINKTGVDLSVSMAVGDNVIFVAYDSTNWEAS
jgi:hypothetical protein